MRIASVPSQQAADCTVRGRWGGVCWGDLLAACSRRSAKLNGALPDTVTGSGQALSSWRREGPDVACSDAGTAHGIDAPVVGCRGKQRGVNGLRNPREASI